MESVPESAGGEGQSQWIGEDASERWLVASDSLVRRPTDLLLGFGADPRQWPNSFDVDRLGPVSTEQWANDFCWLDSLVGRAESTWAQWATSWPLPIGRRAIFQDFPPSKRWDPTSFSKGVPWPDFEYAFFIHTTVLGANIVSIFCLVDRMVAANPQQREPLVWFSKAGIRFVIQGPDPTGFVVSNYVDLARQWWGRVKVLRVNPGRPLGTTARTIADYRAAYRVMVGEDLRRPTRDDFVSRSGIPETTLKRNLRDWGYTWSEFSEECWNMRSQSQPLD